MVVFLNVVSATSRPNAWETNKSFCSTYEGYKWCETRYRCLNISEYYCPYSTQTYQILIRNLDEEISELKAKIERMDTGINIVNNNIKYLNNELYKTRRILIIISALFILENLIILIKSFKKPKDVPNSHRESMG